KAALWEGSSGFISCCPSTREYWGRLDPDLDTPAGTSSADRLWGRPRAYIWRMVGALSPRSTAATAIPASEAKTCTSDWAEAGPPRRSESLCDGAIRAGVYIARRSSWHPAGTR